MNSHLSVDFPLLFRSVKGDENHKGNVTDEDRAQNNELPTLEKTDNENNNTEKDIDIVANMKNNNNNNNAAVEEEVNSLESSTTTTTTESSCDNQVLDVVSVVEVQSQEVVLPEKVVDESSGKTDDERRGLSTVEVGRLDEESHPENASDESEIESDEELHEKTESEKSEKEELTEDDVKPTEENESLENVDKQSEETIPEKNVEVKSEDRVIPEICEPDSSKEEQPQVDEKDVCETEPEIYPDDLNPFGDEEEEKETEKKIEEEIKNASSNPFGSDEENDETRASSTSPNSVAVSAKGTPLVGPPKPPRASLNPFGSDFEDDDDDDVTRSSPVTPRSSHIPRTPASPSLSCVSGMSGRKKRHAPPPPKNVAPVPSPRTSLRTSTTELRRHAPPRPPPPSTPVQPKEQKERENLNRRSQQMLESSSSSDLKSPVDAEPNVNDTKAVDVKSSDKSEIVLTQLPPNKASEGMWKKKKGPAPPRPIPPKLQVKKLPRKAVNQVKHSNMFVYRRLILIPINLNYKKSRLG